MILPGQKLDLWVMIIVLMDLYLKLMQQLVSEEVSGTNANITCGAITANGYYKF